MCDIIEDLRIDAVIENDAGSSNISIDVVLMVYPHSGISALIRDMTWIQDNICPIVGVAGAAAFLVILLVQVVLMLRHKRHGCQSFDNGGKICIKL